LTKVKMPRMDKHEIEQLIRAQFLCRVAFKGESLPYIAPFQYAVIGDTLYFHFTDYGKKMNFFKKETAVCVEIEQYTPDLSEYRFVVLTGKLKLVEDNEERKKAIEEMVALGKQRLSSNFLVAHGFSPDSSWEVFAPDKPVLIMKLEEMAEKTGLKSP
jgi:nitroimidazol reductase NimA-like FMN-containing flavoprotein (pyridoxamine 5'-phosphate oxidase superfamily)